MGGPRRALRVVALALAAAAPPPAAGEAAIGVSLDRPDPFVPASGRVTIEAVVAAEEAVERVAFYVDGVVVGELSEPPYLLEVDVGQENREHRFQVVAYGASGATGSGSLSTPAHRVDDVVSVTLQQLYVTVTRDGRRVLDLERDDFAVFDERRHQPLVTFARGDVPFTAIVLLDASLSMAGGKLAAALAGAETFFGGMQPLDEGKLLAFSDRILQSTPFSTFPEILTAGLSHIAARGGTALNDHLYLALKQLEARQGRRVVVLLSDGVDSHSVLSTTDLLDIARRSQALIYWLRLPYRPSGDGLGGGRRRGRRGGDGDGGDGALPKITSPWRNAEDYLREHELLGETVEESGGRIQPLGSLDEIGPAFEDILAELREQYVLGFYPERARHDGSWHRLSVRLRPPGVEVRCREGYVDY